MKTDLQVSNIPKFLNEILILSVLKESPKHGYQLSLEVEEKSNSFFLFKHGTLYPILHKLEKEGYIKGVWQSEESKRKRKYYTISAKGRNYLQDVVQDLREFNSILENIIGENL